VVFCFDVVGFTEFFSQLDMHVVLDDVYIVALF